MRRWRDSDREPLAAMNADPEVMRYFPAPLTRAESDALVERLDGLFPTHGLGSLGPGAPRVRRLPRLHRAEPAPERRPGRRRAEVGWRLARTAWHHGYATEAARAALRVAASHRIPVVWSVTAVANEPSQAVMRRIGLVPHGHFEHPRVPDGPLRRHVAYRTDGPPETGYRRPAPVVPSP
jgi:RimJ/RimL family protein N-acetyltransferase